MYRTCVLWKLKKPLQMTHIFGKILIIVFELSRLWILPFPVYDPSDSSYLSEASQIAIGYLLNSHLSKSQLMSHN